MNDQFPIGQVPGELRHVYGSKSYINSSTLKDFYNKYKTQINVISKTNPRGGSIKKRKKTYFK